MPRKKLPPSVSGSKTRLQEMQAMRRVLARAIDDEKTPPRELSPLVRRLTELSELIESLEAREAEAREDESARSLIDSAFNLSDI